MLPIHIAKPLDEIRIALEQSLNCPPEMVETDPGINAWQGVPGHERYDHSTLEQAGKSLIAFRNRYPSRSFRLVVITKRILSGPQETDL